MIQEHDYSIRLSIFKFLIPFKKKIWTRRLLFLLINRTHKEFVNIFKNYSLLDIHVFYKYNIVSSEHVYLNLHGVPLVPDPVNVDRCSQFLCDLVLNIHDQTPEFRVNNIECITINKYTNPQLIPVLIMLRLSVDLLLLLFIVMVLSIRFDYGYNLKSIWQTINCVCVISFVGKAVNALRSPIILEGSNEIPFVKQHLYTSWVLYVVNFY